MSPSHAVVDRFRNFSDYLRSSEFKTNPKSNIFTPLRKVSSEPAENNYLPLPNELKVEIARHLNLRDFAALSSTNVDNYLSLRSDDLLVSKVLDNEVQERQERRMLEILEDLKKKAEEHTFDENVPILSDETGNAIIPSIATCPSPSRLIFNSTSNFSRRSFDKFQLIQNLCTLAQDNSTDTLTRALICSLAIDINNEMISKHDRHAPSYALFFLGIASQVKELKNLEDKHNKLNTLANMIKNEEFFIGKLSLAHRFNKILDLSNKNQFEWDRFLDSLR